ncbi:hypothetical protein J4463_02905 [Candidatus Pacearchaeota archaeon]|nr:hypothetical protein [Candidatus Pacearchaeota archaeon]
MLDYFNLDILELSKKPRYFLDKYGNGYWKEYGADFLRTPEFKAYCCERVQMWRDERELI